MQLHELKPSTPRKTAKRIGLGGKRGKTSGRGGKGQTARAGNSTRPEMRDIIKKIPKLRGHGKNRARTVNAEREVAVVINVSVLEANLETGVTVTPALLVATGLISGVRKRAPKIKILGNGDVKKSFMVVDCQVSQSAKTKIEAASGSVK